jgi:hypothetical protein
MQAIQDSSTLTRFQASSVATRYFCSGCSAFVCMEYQHEDHTIWIPLGTVQPDFTPQLDPKKDSHIFQQDKSSLDDKMVQELEHYNDFGTYRSDNCCGKPWDELEGGHNPCK